VQPSRRHAGLACIALALSAGAAACSQPDDAVVLVQQQQELLDASTMMMGSGGTAAIGSGGVPAGSGGAPVSAGSGGAPMPADPCAEKPGLDDLKDVLVNNCVLDKNDPRVKQVMVFFEMTSIAPSGGEGSNISPCNFGWPYPYYEDKMTGQLILCDYVCDGIRDWVRQETKMHDDCIANQMP
jgi:hypothetical protein